MLYNGAVKTTTLHRRQNSSPMEMNSAMRAPLVPTNHHPASHRRGLSIDQARHSQDFQQHFHQQNCGKVSTNNNGSSQQQPPRAAQMPASSRPGPQESFCFPPNTPQSFQAMQFETENSAFRVQSQSSHDFDQSLIFPGTDRIDHQLLKQETLGSTPQLNDLKAGNTISQLVQEIGKLPSHNIQQVFEELGLRYEMTGSREGTQQIGILSDDPRLANDVGHHVASHNHASVAMKRGVSWPEPLKTDVNRFTNSAIPSPPNSAPLRCSATFDAVHFPPRSFMDVRNLKRGLVAVEKDPSSCNYSPMSNRSAMSSFQSSPELAPMNLFAPIAEEDSPFDDMHDIQLFPSKPAAGSKRKGAGLKKAQSMKQASDDDLNFNPNDFLVESSITEEEINAHIQGPEENGKYICLYENCKNAPFGRKENIRAHVQTHLDDRRYKCDACNNKFVRPNDLKRHWQIHVNKRDFKCFCGAAFNRHDALKRHRERSEWCESGGTRGSPDSPKKDEKKRGRPKKIAPTESKERRERKAQIRQEIRMKQASAASSVASSQPSPPAFFDIPECNAAMTDVSGSSPVHLLLSPPASPHHSVDELFSPVPAQEGHDIRRSVSPSPMKGSQLPFDLNDTGSVETFLLQDSDMALAGSSSIGNSSRQGSPPSLDLGSSSPPSRFLDFDFDSTPFCTNSGATESTDKNATEFDQMYRWIFNQDDSQPMSGIDPNQMHLSPTMDDQNDSMPW